MQASGNLLLVALAIQIRQTPQYFDTRDFRNSEASPIIAWQIHNVMKSVI